MLPALLLAISVALILGGAVAYFLFPAAAKQKPPAEEPQDAARPAAAPRAPARGGTARMRRRQVANANAAATASAVAPPAPPQGREGGEAGGGAGREEEDRDGDEDDDGDDAEGGADGYYKAKGAKARKEAKKREKEARREAEAAAREARGSKQDQYADRQKAKDAAREEEERREAAELAERQARQAAEEKAELDKWQGMFSVEAEGTVEADAQEGSQGLLQDFVDYIKRHKCVVLEDLAAEFGLRAQDAVNRVIALEEMGRITGVMDDRGKFIYISLEEMAAVAEYIRRAGRVSIADLASKSNTLVDLEARRDNPGEAASAAGPEQEPWQAEGEQEQAAAQGAAVPVA